MRVELVATNATGSWRGVDSPRAPWRKDPKAPSFPSFTQMLSRPDSTGEKEPQEVLPAPTGLPSLQKVLTVAKKAEQKVKRLTQERDTLVKQWNIYEDKLKAAWTKEKKKFQEAAVKYDHAITEAHQQQDAARRIVITVANGGEDEVVQSQAPMDIENPQ